MQFDTLVVINYPNLGYMYVLKVEKEHNQVHYSYIGRDTISFKDDSEIEKFCNKLEELTKDWNENYTTCKDARSDGNSFVVRFFLGEETVKEYKGTNNCPSNFKEFCETIENFTHKNFGSEYFK